MAVYEIFSERQKRLRGEPKDPYQYDEIPERLQLQIAVIVEKLDIDIERIKKILYTEYGQIPDHTQPWYVEPDNNSIIIELIRHEKDFNIVMDSIELCFQNILSKKKSIKKSAIHELNERCQRNSFGYQFENGMFIKIDSQFEHAEVVKPAIALLNDDIFKGASDEFMKAHEHYRAGEYEASMTEAAKSFESVLKIIIAKRGWEYGERDTAKKLLDTVRKNGLIPDYMDRMTNALMDMLEHGVPKLRNTQAAHGQGEQIRSVQVHTVAYTLHMTAAAIVFLVNADKALDA